MDKKSGSGIGFLGVLTIVFIVLKLLGVIGWSWWWVFAPMWAPIIAAMIVAAVVMFCNS